MRKLLCAGVAICGFAGQAGAVADKYDITPAEHAACDDDAARLCFSAYPDEDKLLDCMRSNLSQLKPICLSTFKAGLKRRKLGAK